MVEQNIREFAPSADIHFDRIAVTPAQITEFGLLTRPTKKTDSRAKNFEGESVEVDAIPPKSLRQMLRARVEGLVDRRALDILNVAEESEKTILKHLAYLKHDSDTEVEE